MILLVFPGFITFIADIVLKDNKDKEFEEHLRIQNEIADSDMVASLNHRQNCLDRELKETKIIINSFQEEIERLKEKNEILITTVQKKKGKK